MPTLQQSMCKKLVKFGARGHGRLRAELGGRQRAGRAGFTQGRIEIVMSGIGRRQRANKGITRGRRIDRGSRETTARVARPARSTPAPLVHPT